jgi:hypothetical protein
LLLTVFARGREQGNRPACVSNLRQIHALMARFAGDNNGEIPIGYRMGQKQFNTTLYSASAQKYVLLGKLMQAGLATDPRIFFCPSERDPTQAYNTKDNPWPIQAGKNLQGGFGCNPVVDWGTADVPPEWPLQSRLDHVPLLADGVGMPARVDSRHKDGVNVLYSEGNVRWVPREKFNAYLATSTTMGAGSNDAQQQIWDVLAELKQ